MFKVTVVVAIYNVAEHLKKCIRSILDQTYKELEIILVNDGSTDNCLEICREFSLMDGRITVLDQPNQGVSAARNNGIEHASGDFIMFVDGDDCLRDNIVSELLKKAEKNDIIICSYNAFNEQDGSSVDCHFFPGSRTFKKAKNDLFLQLINLSYAQSGEFYTAVGVPWGKLYRRSFIEENHLRFDRRLIRLQDNIFNMKAFTLTDRIIYIDKPLYMYRLNNIVRFKKLPYKPEILIDVLHEREKIIMEAGLDSDKRIMDFFAEETALCAVKTEIYTSRTERLRDFREVTSRYLGEDIYKRYKYKSFFVSKRAFVINAYLALGLNFLTYFGAKHVKF